jgi:uncharacterized protein
MTPSPSPGRGPQGTSHQAAWRRWRWWVLAACVGLPLLVFGVSGTLWLYERHWLRWVGLAVLCGEALLLWLARRWSRKEAALLPQPSATLPPAFAPRDEAAWALVQAYLERIERGEIVLEGPEQFLALGRDMLERIAVHYNPTVRQPLLAIPVPLLCRAIEETARDLAQITTSLPLAHRITIGEVVHGYRLHQKIMPAYNVYRALYPLFNWHNALFQYLVTDRLFDLTKQTLTQWLLKWYVDRVGYHAIALYSGQLLLTRQLDLSASMPQPLDTRQPAAAAQTVTTTPLRILIVGQVKAGKSSLVNALFGIAHAATDVLPTTAKLTSYVLDRSDLGNTIIVSDMGGYEDPSVPQGRLAEALAEAQRADLLLFVLSAVNAAREPDRHLLSQLRHHFAAQSAIRPPPVVVVLTHIDVLRPRREWTPPYNIVSPDTAKAHAIRNALQTVAAELQLAPELIVPVCLLPESLYNVEEALVPLLIQVLPDAKRVLLLRSLKTLRQQEEWELLGRQARATGRLLLQLSGEVAKKALEHMLAQGKM